MTTWTLFRVGCLTNGNSHVGCHGGSCGEQSPCRKCPKWPAEQSPTDSLRPCGSIRRTDDCPGVCPAPKTSWWREIPLPTLDTVRQTDRRDKMHWCEVRGKKISNWKAAVLLSVVIVVMETTWVLQNLIFHIFLSLLNIIKHTLIDLLATFCAKPKNPGHPSLVIQFIES